MLKTIKNALKTPEVRKKLFYTLILIVIFTIMTYGIKIFNYSISIDTEKLINQYDWQMDTWASFGRFGLVFTKKLFGLNHSSSIP